MIRSSYWRIAIIGCAGLALFAIVGLGVAVSQEAEPAKDSGDPDSPAKSETPKDADQPGELDDLLEGLDEPADDEDQPLEGAADSPFSKISHTMRRAERLIARADGEKTAPLHDEIVHDLDALIAKMQKQCEACKGGGKPKPGAKSSSKPGSGKTGGGGGGASKGGQARDSTSKTRDMKTEEVERGAGQLQLIKALWGGLPEREQLEKLRQFQEEEFVPEFELLTEEYFKALAGSTDDQP